jgi:predicted peroxiredoxin
MMVGVFFAMLIVAEAFAQQGQMGHGMKEMKGQRADTGYLFHLSSGPDEARRVLVPLTLAMMISNDGTPVQLFMDQEAVVVAHKDAEPISHPDFPKNSEELLNILVERGIGIAVCPLCMKGENMTKEDLRDGAVLFSPDKLSSFTDGRIITMDW